MWCGRSVKNLPLAPQFVELLGRALRGHDDVLAILDRQIQPLGENLGRLAGALQTARIHGVTTNRDLLVRLLRHDEFVSGDFDTSFFDRHGLAELGAPLVAAEMRPYAALAAALADAAENRSRSGDLAGLPIGWRNVPAVPQRKEYISGADAFTVDYRCTRTGLIADGYNDVVIVEVASNRVVIDIRGVRTGFDVAVYGNTAYVDSAHGAVALAIEDRFPDSTDQLAAGTLLAPMPGTITAIHVSDGDEVEQGIPLLTLEAMKMHHTINAPDSGTVALAVRVGQQVESGAAVAVVSGGGDDR